MHGITVRRKPTDGSGDPRVSEMSIRRVSVRYGDGRRMNFIPEAREEFFSQDDLQGVVGILRKSSSALEWGQMPEGHPYSRQGGGLI